MKSFFQLSKLLRICMIAASIILLMFSCGAQENPSKLMGFKLSDVKITKGPFYQAQQADLQYMLALDPDRLLAPFLKDAGFKPLKENYPNWENTGLDGHIGGHYLSAMSLMYASTGNKEVLRRINYMLDWLSKCQEKNGNGYVAGIPDGKRIWKEIFEGKIEASSFSLNKGWVPLYNIHKLYAGLRDVYQNTGIKKSLEMLVKLTDWMIDETKNLADNQIQEMLKSEHGGLNETFVDVAQITGNKKYLELARRFSQNALLNPLLKRKNELTGLHANTQIPKVIGYERYAEATGDTAWSGAADFFWNTVIDDWTVSIGGNSVREHFHPANDFSSMIESNQGPETCNTYNMLRLTKLLFLSDPKSKYIDYYERALYNHILSSEDPVKGGFVYFTPMRPRHYRVYSQPQLSFWCCVGSGLENHGKYGEMIYLHDDNNLYVNLFIPSELNWKEKGLKLVQNTEFPYSETSEIKIQLDKPRDFVLNIRNPHWLKESGLIITVNGKELTIDNKTYPYIKINRKWKNGDIVSITLPMKMSVEYLPDHSHWASFLCGPIVLAAISDTSNQDGLWADDSRMGHVASGKLYPIDESPTIISKEDEMISKLKPVAGKPLTFKIDAQVIPENFKDLELKPFFSIQEARYIIYWPVETIEEFNRHKDELQQKENQIVALENKTVDQVAPGEQQPESDHNFKGQNTNSGINQNHHWRDATGWFSYDFKDKNKESRILRLSYFGLDKNREFQIVINGTVLATVKLDGSKGNTFFDADYAIPDNIILNSNGIINIRFVAVNDKIAGSIYYARLLKE